jgi:hypothetical protein
MSQRRTNYRCNMIAHIEFIESATEFRRLSIAQLPYGIKRVIYRLNRNKLQADVASRVPNYTPRPIQSGVS